MDAPHDPPRDPVPVPTAAGAPTGDWRSVYAAALCHRVTSGPFTHDIGEVRVNLTDHGLAAAVYAQAAAFGERGLAITERRLSAVVRLRVEVRFDRALTPDSFGPDRTYRAVTNAVRGALVPCLAPGARGPVHRYLTCFVARPALVDGGFDRLWFHFPGIAAAFHDLKRLSGPIEASVTEAVEGAACTVLSVVGSSHPLYACDPRTMGVVGVITGHPEADALEFTAAWLAAARTDAFRWVAHHNDGVGWAQRPVEDEAALRARLAVLFSVNPMGTPALPVLTDALASDVAAGMPVDPDLFDVLRHALSLLSPRRRTNPDEARGVGELVHAAAKGAHWGLRLWTEWVCSGASSAEADTAAASERKRIEADHYAEWADFNGDICAGRSEDMDALSGLVFADASADNYAEFSKVQLRILNRNRPTLGPDGADDTLKVWGGLNHTDIARFLVAHLHGTMHCVNARSGLWFIYRADHHRWQMDEVGMEALLRCTNILHRYVDDMRREVTEAMLAAAGSTTVPPSANRNNAASVQVAVDHAVGQNAQRGVSNVYQMANWGALSGADAIRIKREIVVHLDRQIGDFRSLSGIMKMLANCLVSRDFHFRLDTTNEHILPFANGVLDLQTLQFRDGRPVDMVMKGPTYAFHDYDADDPRVQDVERMLAQIFTDTSLVDFFLTFGASLLRRRNRFKHFYIKTGGTNAGKSQILNIIKQGLGTLCGTLPIQAITARELSASGQTDYLARTQGMALCVCHEPDSSTQQLLNDRVKVMTSDSDHHSVREMYGREKEIAAPPGPLVTVVSGGKRAPVAPRSRGSSPSRVTTRPATACWTLPLWTDPSSSPSTPPSARTPPTSQTVRPISTVSDGFPPAATWSVTSPWSLPSVSCICSTPATGPRRCGAPTTPPCSRLVSISSGTCTCRRSPSSAITYDSSCVRRATSPSNRPGVPCSASPYNGASWTLVPGYWRRTAPGWPSRTTPATSTLRGMPCPRRCGATTKRPDPRAGCGARVCTFSATPSPTAARSPSPT